MFGKYILIDNMKTGWDVYTVGCEDTIPTKRFPVSTARHYIRGGCFAEDGSIVACGSDHGKIYAGKIIVCDSQVVQAHCTAQHPGQTLREDVVEVYSVRVC